MIKQFFRDVNNNQPLGVLMAEMTPEGLKIGWSVTHRLDKFNKAKGERIAKGRLASHVPGQQLIVPSALVDLMVFFVNRAERYFKTTTESIVIDGWVLKAKKPH